MAEKKAEGKTVTEDKPRKKPEAEAKEKKDFKYIVRIAGTDIDGNKKLEYSLCKIKGVGRRVARAICVLAGVDYKKVTGRLTDREVDHVNEVVENLGSKNIPAWMMNRRQDRETGKDMHVITSDLMMSLREDLNRYRKIRSYIGIRHESGLPVRGQRTRSSFRKGLTVGVSRKKLAQSKSKGGK